MIKTCDLTDASILYSYAEKFNGYSSIEDMEYMANNPYYVLFYNEIKRFSKKEIESATPLRHSSNLLKIFLYNKKPLLFAALLEKKAFLTELSDFSQNIIKKCKNHDLQMYNAIYMIEEGYQKNNPNNLKESIKTFLDYYYFYNKQDKNFEVINFIISKYKKHKTIFLGIVEEYHKHPNILNFITILQNHNIDLNSCGGFKVNYDTYNSNADNFFISSTYDSKYENLLSLGMQINEKDFSFFNQTLLTSLIKGKRKELLGIFLPHIKEYIPRNMTIEEQDALFEELQTTHPKIYNSNLEAYYSLKLKNCIPLSNKIQKLTI